jgi:hypothetical protein
MASVAAGGRAAVRRTTSSLLVATTKHSMKGQESSMPHSTSVSVSGMQLFIKMQANQ